MEHALNDNQVGTSEPGRPRRCANASRTASLDACDDAYDEAADSGGRRALQDVRCSACASYASPSASNFALSLSTTHFLPDVACSSSVFFYCYAQLSLVASA
jgi:hypothetical protein